ncbi:hypothetical protein GCM10025789_06550 [Tessaracoccus lubricantis]|uniref:Uncharacterized protein n=1 Tax=Tessaracoccus lubricantis TaxID=545543 RepID=A0ABP9F549_9ACTN
MSVVAYIFKVSGELQEGPKMTSITITLEKTHMRRDAWSQGDIRIIKEDLASLGAVSTARWQVVRALPQHQRPGGGQHPSGLHRFPGLVRAGSSPREVAVARPFQAP